MTVRPPSGTTVRAATPGDAGALAELFNVVTTAEAGVPWTDEAEMRRDLTAPSFDPEHDAALVHDAYGRLVAGLLLYPDGPPVTDVFALGLVHPDSYGRGLGTFVTLLGESLAHRKLPFAVPTGRVTVHGSRFVQNEDAARLFRDLGYRNVRTWWRMTIELGDDVPVPAFPEGIGLRPFDRDRDTRAAHDALREAFHDHWGEGMRAYEPWSVRLAGSDDAPPAFVLAAIEGDEIAGVLVGRPAAADPEAGVVEELGVRRPWRGRGLGLALLRSGFRELRRRGLTRAILNVDAESPTGATRLYERAGMRVQLAWDRWEKELRGAPTV